jgi:hypothetical protein
LWVVKEVKETKAPTMLIMLPRKTEKDKTMEVEVAVVAAINDKRRTRTKCTLSYTWARTCMEEVFR